MTLRTLSMLVLIFGAPIVGCSDDDVTPEATLQNAVKHLCDCAESDYCSKCTDTSHPDCKICKDRQTCETLSTTNITRTTACYSCILGASCADLTLESTPPCKNACNSSQDAAVSTPDSSIVPDGRTADASGG